jgi:hypothetical protein
LGSQANEKAWHDNTDAAYLNIAALEMFEPANVVGNQMVRLR